MNPPAPEKSSSRKANIGKKRALGRGLDSLIPDITSLSDGSADYFLCDIEQIRPNRFQPRRRFAQAELSDLSRSIRKQGIIQPLVIRQGEDGYELITGERRLRAAKLAGLQQVPVVLTKADDSEVLELSIIENIQREDLNPIEEANAYHRLIEDFHLTQEEAAARIGKSRSAVANAVRLRQLSEEIQESIISGQLSMGHARAILSADGATKQAAAWRKVISKGLSVRETEALVKRINREERTSTQARVNSENNLLVDIAEELSRAFGTKVEIKKRGRRGKIQIDFYSNDDLDRLIRLLRQT